jgi:hypothetical protein
VPAIALVVYLGWIKAPEPGEATDPVVALERTVVAEQQPPDQVDEPMPAQERAENVSIPDEPQTVEPVGSPANLIEAIQGRASDAGTEIVIRGNGALTDRVIEVFPMRDPPRILIRVRGIDRGYSPYTVPVGSAEVDRIRMGHHPEMSPPALYVVADLADPNARVIDTAYEGDTVRVLIGP